MSEQASPPAWLFSFVDLAFLLLIAMTQLQVMKNYNIVCVYVWQESDNFPAKVSDIDN